MLCEVLLTDMTPHPSNTRAQLRAGGRAVRRPGAHGSASSRSTRSSTGSRPLGFPPGGFPAPQGGYYCGVGADEIFGRPIVEKHLDNCLAAGLSISGINAEVMPGQWEFQVGPLSPLDVSDQLWVARWLLYRTAEEFDVSATLDPKPVKGDWNGAGGHTNFSTKAMREAYDPIIAACEALAENPLEHVKDYGFGIEFRLTGLHETAPWNEFSYGVSDRGASVRIPWQVEVGQEGLHRGPPAQRQLRPLPGDPPHRVDLLLRPGEGAPGRLTDPDTCTQKGPRVTGAPSLVLRARRPGRASPR